MPRKARVPTPAENTAPTSHLVEGVTPTDPGNDIDDRMAALLKDHQAMGARPTTEPEGDQHDSSYPLKAKSKAKK